MSDEPALDPSDMARLGELAEEAQTPDQPPNAIEAEIGKRPFEIAAQAKLFKSGLYGEAVTVWSKYDGGYGPSRLMFDDDPVVIRVDDDNIDVAIGFAGAYILGWNERLGGKTDKLHIWLEPYEGEDDGD